MIKYNNKKGFSLPELLAVMAIMAVLAVISAPFIRDYMRDAEHDRAATILQLIAHGVKTFRADYPRATLTGGEINAATAPIACTTILDRTGTYAVGILLGCNYIQGLNFTGHSTRYTFYAGQCPGVAASAGALACMRGIGKHASYGATWITAHGEVMNNL